MTQHLKVTSWKAEERRGHITTDCALIAWRSDDWRHTVPSVTCERRPMATRAERGLVSALTQDFTWSAQHFHPLSEYINLCCSVALYRPINTKIITLFTDILILLMLWSVALVCNYGRLIMVLGWLICSPKHCLLNKNSQYNKSLLLWYCIVIITVLGHALKTFSSLYRGLSVMWLETATTKYRPIPHWRGLLSYLVL